MNKQNKNYIKEDQQKKLVYKPTRAAPQLGQKRPPGQLAPHFVQKTIVDQKKRR